MTIEKGSAVGPTEGMLTRVQRRIFLPGGGHVPVRSQEGPKPKARITMIPYMEDLKRGPHIPMVVSGPKRLIAFCCACQRTIDNLPLHVGQFNEHRDAIRYTLLPDLRGAA